MTRWPCRPSRTLIALKWLGWGALCTPLLAVLAWRLTVLPMTWGAWDIIGAVSALTVLLAGAGVVWMMRTTP